MRIGTALTLTALLAGNACDTEVTGLSDGEPITVRVTVTGGIAAADYTFELQDDGVVLGIRCVNLCTFLPGDTLVRLTPAQRSAVKSTVVESGLHDAGRPVNFGTECCDQFTYKVTYTSGTVVRSFTGGVESMPEPLGKLVRALQLVYLGTPPLIVAQTTGLEGFSLDPLGLLDARVDGGVLEVDVSFSGGCGIHDVDAVAHTGWMESNPVQVGVALTHEDHDDACDAIVEQTLRFDLEPLKDAYTDVYGVGPSTLLLNVGPGSGGAGRQVTYSL